MRLARLFESLPLVGPQCGADVPIIAFVTEASPVQRIITPIGEPAEPPPIAPAHGSPMGNDGLDEAVFRSLKSELGLRPVFHHKTERVSGHLFISVLA